MGESVEEAEQRGWLDGHIVGMFPEEAASLRGRYDVISMFHYLEHTVDPRAEIEASHEALSPGGVIVIEVPNPECPLGRWLGKFWVCWLQPQHLHLLPPQAMKELLSETGFDTLELELEEAHIPVDFLFAARLFRNWAGGFPNHPWRHRRTLMGTLRYYLASGVVMFLSIGALIIDRVAAAVFRRMGISNAYRLVARKAVESE
jgi:SAM-dependent methyltransferase